MERLIDANAFKQQAAAECIRQGLDVERVAAFFALVDSQPTAIPADITAMQTENKRLTSELNAYRQAEAEGTLVKLPDKLVAPYELNERYWICGWDLESCAFIIQDRALKKQMDSAALQEVQPADATDAPDPYKP